MRRSLLFLGRLGTVIIFVSFAILLASGIGPVSIGGSSNKGTLSADSFNILQGPLFADFYTSNSLVNLNPQNAVIISINATNQINAYLIQGNRSVIEDWIRENHPDQPTNASVSPKNTVLDQFLAANPDLILWQGQGKNIHLLYAPKQVMNLTVIVSNQNSFPSNISYSINVQYGFASLSRMRLSAIWILPIGLVFALPRAILRIKQRRSKQ